MYLDICNDYNVKKTSFRCITIEYKSFNVAIKGYLNRNSDTLQKTYDLITAKSKAAWYVLKTMHMHNKDSIKAKDLVQRINPKHQLITKDEIQQALIELQSHPYYIIIRYDEYTDSFSFSTPFWSPFIRIQLESEQAEKNKNQKKKRISCQSRHI